MRINVDLEQFLTWLASIASDAKDQARIKFPGAQADIVTMGIAFLLENITILMRDATEFDIGHEQDAQVLHGAVSKFCRGWCHYSRESAPGTHERCVLCPLMPFDAGALEAVAKKLAD